MARLFQFVQDRSTSGIAAYTTALLAACTFAGPAPPSAITPDESVSEVASSLTNDALSFDCGFIAPGDTLEAINAAVRLGQIEPPSRRALPSIATRSAGTSVPGCTPLPTADDIYPFEDSGSVLLTNYTLGQLIDLMTRAANELLAREGDEFDFIGFWTNFVPSRTVGTAFFLSIENDVSGIGADLYNLRPSMGVAGNHIEGYVMMWNINNTDWQAGTAPGADFTRLALAHELEHRFGMFLPPLLDGRRLQGLGNCGRPFHWSQRVDGQGSGMEIGEWIGAQPATRIGFLYNFNSDIGGVFSYSDLYLMGYVSAEEMDAGNSELRYVDDDDRCASPYHGPLSDFTSADVVAAAGRRIPSATAAQHHFRTGWIMLHLPGAPPTFGQRFKAAAILTQATHDWEFSTLGRGTMNHALRSACRPVVEWRPVDADVPHAIDNGTIVIPEGEARVTLELSVSDWHPSPLSGYDIVIDPSGYNAVLTPVTTPDVGAGAYIDTGRDDYLFAGLPGTTAVDTGTQAYRWLAATAAADAVLDEGLSRYAGTLILDVPATAAGTFELYPASPPDTLLVRNDGVAITEIETRPAVITVVPDHTTCGTAREITCDSSTVFRNDIFHHSPEAAISCGDDQSGTVWFRFEAASPFAVLSSCRSDARDSVFAVYDGECETLVEKACSKDGGCGTSQGLGTVTLTGLTVGQTYFVAFAAAADEERGEYTLEVTCTLPESEPPRLDPSVPVGGNGAMNRYLSFRVDQPARNLGVRITPIAMPPGMETVAGRSLWVGPPEPVSEYPTARIPPGVPDPGHFQLATLQCEPYTTDWSRFANVYVSHDSIVPGATYVAQAVDITGLGIEALFSIPLTLTTSRWGDVAGVCGPQGCSAPDGRVDVAVDAVAVLDKFANLPAAPAKVRTDVFPAPPDHVINILDVVAVLDAFRGLTPPLILPPPCP